MHNVAPVCEIVYDHQDLWKRLLPLLLLQVLDGVALLVENVPQRLFVPLAKKPTALKMLGVLFYRVPSTIDLNTWAEYEDPLVDRLVGCLLYTSPSPRDRQKSRMPSSA